MPGGMNLGGQASEEVVLKACPFCGSTADAPIEKVVHLVETEIDYDDGLEGYIRWTVQCDNCTATMGYCDDPDRAIADWNLRTPHPSGDTGGIVERLARVRDLIEEPMFITVADGFARYNAEERDLILRAAVDAHALIEQQAATIAELREVLEMTTRAVEIVNETMAEQGFGQSNNSVAVAQIARATLERTKQP